MGTIVLAWLAGVLSTLSPCVLPLLPVVLATAAGQHRLGPLALAGGLALSFTIIGLFIATIGFEIGLDDGVFRTAAGLVLMALGAVLLLPSAQMRLAAAASPIQGWTEQRFSGFGGAGLKGQFGVGLLLGAVWSPCVGPTLGAASVLAARGESLGTVAATMAVFGIGAATPLVLLGSVSRTLMLRLRARLSNTGQSGKIVLGLIFLAVGLLVVSGQDKAIEAALTQASPEWLTRLTTMF